LPADECFDAIEQSKFIVTERHVHGDVAMQVMFMKPL